MWILQFVKSDKSAAKSSDLLVSLRQSIAVINPQYKYNLSN